MKIASAPKHTVGLSSAEVEQSRRLHGTNTLTVKQRTGFAKRYLQSFGDPLIKILLAALIVNLMFMFHRHDWFESIGIAVAVFLATFLSTLSEYGSEAAFLRLQEQADNVRCRVYRNGRLTVLPIGELVVGDVVLLGAGDAVPADGKLTEGRLQVDQSALNGESREVVKQLGTDSGPPDLSDTCHVFRGTVVCSGEGTLLVQTVGDHTFYGGMAGELQEETRESPLKVRLNELAKIISRIGYAAAACVAIADLFYSFVVVNGFHAEAILAQLTNPAVVFSQVMHAITLGITVIVVAVPEGLPMMITVVLSSNMRRMLRDNVLVRKLVGIETSGSLNILFCDKTGTLTAGKPQVTRWVLGNGKELYTKKEAQRCKALWQWISFSCAVNSESRLTAENQPVGGNATDRALMNYVLPLPHRLPAARDRIPFDSARKFSACTADINGKSVVLVKGAPEKILPLCSGYIGEDGSVHSLPEGASQRFPLIHAHKQMTENAMRVLALAIADADGVKQNSLPRKMTLVGLAGIRDELRPQARGAVGQIRGAGIQVVMLTGDNRDTAAAIATAAGILEQHYPPQAILTADEMAALSDRQLQERLPQLRVVARALPTDKSRLVRLSQQAGAVVGMTGDGINDAPALKKADVGFAMGSATAVAKEAGDIVILDDNIASIAKAILYGRTIFKSIRKFLVFQLTMNLCAVGISLIGPFIGIDTPVTVVQMLWINIIMDTLAGLAFAGEPPLKEYMKEPPKKRDEPVLNRYMLSQIIGMGLFTIGLYVAFLKWEPLTVLFSGGEAHLMTAFFALFIFCGVFNAFNARTQRLHLGSSILHNPLFFTIMLTVSVIQLLLIYFGGTLFRTVPLSIRELTVVWQLAFLVIPADIIRKILLRLTGHKGTL